MIKDSGERRQFESGAVRDMGENGMKGRTDLLPLEIVADMLGDPVIKSIYGFMQTQDTQCLEDAITTFIHFNNWDMYTALLEVAIHYEEGAKKYDERNWEKGIPNHCYIDSALRHYLKWLRKDNDERHDRAFVWNILGLMFNMNNRPECNDLPEIKNEVHTTRLSKTSNKTNRRKR